MSSSISGRPDRDSTDVVGSRIGAQVVDLILQFVQVLAVTAALASLFRPEGEAAARGLVGLGFLTLPLYGGLLEGTWNGQTVGKRLAGIRVVSRRGRDPSLGQALARNLPAVVLFSWLTSAVALAAIAMSERNQRVFDGIAGTYVVRA
ncbi:MULTISPECIES: RDD family protein [Halorussus]|uniref:RDD family protein n=1 Tax=Halorussus TaxID=1070314 RepID=UPI000E2193B8|nr:MULTISPECIES: RDD family protein [Halorussus]NHN59130.1 RDD family protein [Halorussus sp. JP-T4]